MPTLARLVANVVDRVLILKDVRHVESPNAASSNEPRCLTSDNRVAYGRHVIGVKR